MNAAFLSKSSIYEGDYNCILRSPANELNYKLHYHDFYEVVIYLGSATFCLEGNTYELNRGDITLIGIFEPHTLVYDPQKYYERLCISINPDLLLSFCTPESNLLDVFTPSSSKYPVFHVQGEDFGKYLAILEQYKTLSLKHGNDMFNKALIHQILAYVYNDCYDGAHSESTYSRHVATIARLVEFIDRHLAEDLSLARLASEVNYSECYICRIFKKVTNKTLNYYIIEKRIEKATYYLKSALPINQIAQLAGFNNYSHFYKIFKKTNGCSPAEYRAKTGVPEQDTGTERRIET